MFYKEEIERYSDLYKDIKDVSLKSYLDDDEINVIDQVKGLDKNISVLYKQRSTLIREDDLFQSTK